MRRLLISAAIFVGISACVPATTSTPATESVAPTASASQSGSVSSSVGQALNAERRTRGLSVLTESAQLNRAAAAHARDMTSRGYFSHTGPNGNNQRDRIESQGYRACSTGENIAAGQDSAAEVMAAWMGSSGHRANNLRSSFSQYGAARSGSNWVLVFARPGC